MLAYYRFLSKNTIIRSNRSRNFFFRIFPDPQKWHTTQGRQNWDFAKSSPLESLVKKFAYQRFEPSGFTRNPEIRQATSITDYVFRWLGCRFIAGYRESTSPTKGQQELAMPSLPVL